MDNPHRKKVRRRKDASVTREEIAVERDGEQLVRVKSKRRRSKQEKDKNRELLVSKIFWRSFVAFLAIAFIVASVTLRLLYVNGPKYEKKLSENLEKQLNADLSIRGLAFSPNRFRMARINYRSLEQDYFLNHAQLDEISAPHNYMGAITGTWKGSAVHAKMGSFIFNFKNSYYYLEF